MHDIEFKKFRHCLPDGAEVLSTGQNLFDGYMPDISIQNSYGEVYIILESERKSERKAFIGAMVKASYFAHETKSPISLIFVMKETGTQTTVKQVSSNIAPYFKWLNSLGATELTQVCFISHPAYIESANNKEALLSPKFLERCIVLKANK